MYASDLGSTGALSMRVFQALSGGKMPFPAEMVSGVEVVPASTLAGVVPEPASDAGVAGSPGPLPGTAKVVIASVPTPQAANRKESARKRSWCRFIERRPLLNVTWCVGVGIDID